jgi:type II secretory pathway pseudopilin PulG
MKWVPNKALQRSAAFTMVEIALSIAIVAFALVAIIGVLPTGLNVQRENREDTIINSEAQFWIEAIRSGSRDLMSITSAVDVVQIGYSFQNNSSVNYLTNPWHNVLGPINTNRAAAFPGYVVGVLTSPAFGPTTNDPLRSVTIRSRAISGPLSDKGSTLAARDFAFAYHMTVELIPYDSGHATVLGVFNNTNNLNLDPLTNYTFLAISNFNLNAQQIAYRSNNYLLYRMHKQMQANLYELRLSFAWPVIPDLSVPFMGQVVGNNRRTYRALLPGSIVLANPANVNSDTTANFPIDLFQFLPTAFLANTNN